MLRLHTISTLVTLRHISRLLESRSGASLVPFHALLPVAAMKAEVLHSMSAQEPKEKYPTFTAIKDLLSIVSIVLLPGALSLQGTFRYTPTLSVSSPRG